MTKITEAMRACLSYYRDNEHNSDRRQRPPYTWTTRQVNTALARGWLKVGPGGWHILSEAGRAALAQSAAPVAPASGGVEAIAAERRRQIEAEGWTTEHDDTHTRGEMAAAAGVYALAAASQNDYRFVLIGSPVNDCLAGAMELWPWEKSWFKPTDRRRDLVKAGALIAAEIDRLDRIPVQQAAPSGEGE